MHRSKRIVGEINFYEKRTVINRICRKGFAMKQRSFTHQNRRLTKTLRVHYGLEGMKYIIQIYAGEINGHGEKEGLPTEYQYEFEQEMLKHVYDLKKEMREKGWMKRDSPEVSQTSFLRTDLREDELSNLFE